MARQYENIIRFNRSIQMNDEIVVTPKDNGRMDVEVKQVDQTGTPQDFLPLSGMMI